MKNFKDKTGQSWTIDVTVGSIKRVKSLIGINLMDMVGSDLIEKLKTDPCLLCDVIYCVCKPEADAKSIGDEAFGELLAGDAISEATEALISDVVDFFPTSQRTILKATLAKIAKVEEQLTQATMAKVDAMLEKELSKHLSDITDGSGRLQEKSE